MLLLLLALGQADLVGGEVKRLATFKKTIQDNTEYAPDTEPAAGGAAHRAATAEALASEADVFRREIAERIAKLIPPA